MPAARTELLEVVRYYEEQRTGLGRSFAQEVNRAVKRIVTRPLACPKHLANTRRCRLNRFQYGVVYRVVEAEIRVVAIMHLHRRPGYWRGRR